MFEVQKKIPSWYFNLAFGKSVRIVWLPATRQYGGGGRVSVVVVAVVVVVVVVAA